MVPGTKQQKHGNIVTFLDCYLSLWDILDPEMAETSLPRWVESYMKRLH